MVCLTVGLACWTPWLPHDTHYTVLGGIYLSAIAFKIMGVWHGVAMDSLKYR
jgi:hypothetical protein